MLLKGLYFGVETSIDIGELCVRRKGQGNYAQTE